MNTFNRYHKAVAFVENLPLYPTTDYTKKKASRSLFLRRFDYFLEHLGHPERGLRFIHVNGTSGKGSTAVMIQEILSAAGFKTGLYTSPHTVTTIERFKINNRFIAPDAFADLVEKVRPHFADVAQHSPYGAPSYFEVMTAIAFLYFQKKRCDYVVLEVGLGGGFDATNAIEPPIATIMNTISYDHQDILGKTIAKIAREKSGIIKTGTTVFMATRNTPTAINVVKKQCHATKATLRLIEPTSVYQLAMPGDHQRQNAGLAEAVCRFLGIDKTSIAKGLRRAKLPCRFEVIAKNPTIILDGAHNDSKIASTLAHINQLTYKNLYLIIALTKSRDPKKILTAISKKANAVYCTTCTASDRTFHTPKDLARRLKTVKNKKTFSNPEQALNDAQKYAQPDDLIVVTGSLYLSGQLRQRFVSEQSILTQRHF